MLAVGVVAILAGAIAAARSTGHQQLHFGAEVLPRAADLERPIALNAECSGRIKTRCENAELQRVQRQRCSLAVRFDVLARELDPVWTLAQADFYGFGF